MVQEFSAGAREFAMDLARHRMVPNHREDLMGLKRSAQGRMRREVFAAQVLVVGKGVLANSASVEKEESELLVREKSVVTVEWAGLASEVKVIAARRS